MKKEIKFYKFSDAEKLYLLRESDMTIAEFDKIIEQLEDEIQQKISNGELTEREAEDWLNETNPVTRRLGKAGKKRK